MDFAFELLTDLIFEGSLYASTSRKMPAWVRYPLIALIGLVFAAGVGCLLLAGVLTLRENTLLGVLFLLLGAALGIFIVRKFYRVYVTKRESWE